MNKIFKNLLSQTKKTKNLPIVLIIFCSAILLTTADNLPWFITYLRAVINNDQIPIPWGFMVVTGVELLCVAIAMVLLLLSRTSDLNRRLSTTLTTKIIFLGALVSLVITGYFIRDIQTAEAIVNLRNYLLTIALYLVYIQRDYWKNMVMIWVLIATVVWSMVSQHIKSILIITGITFGLALVGYWCLYQYASYGNYDYKYWGGLSVAREFHINDTDPKDRQCAEEYLKAAKTTIGKSGFAHKPNVDPTGCLNIDEEGVRRTWQPPKHNQKEFVIWVLGGSTIYSGYTADEKTIPSYLAKLLYSAGVKNIKVVNLGISAYNAIQARIRFEQALVWNKQPPNLILFYEGVNEIVVATENLNNEHIDNYPSLNFFYNRYLADVIEKNQDATAVFNRFISLIFQEKWRTAVSRFKFNNNLPQKPAEHPNLNYQTSLTIGKQAFEAYLTNMEFVEATAKRLNIPVIFFLQPHIFTKNIKSKLEEKNTKPYQYFSTAYAVYYRLAKEKIASGKYPNWVDLSDTFRNDSRNLFFDWCHCRAEANKQIAERIGEHLIIHGLVNRQ